MLRDSSGCASFCGSSNPSTAAVASAGACLTSNPSYQAAVPSSPGYGVATSGACSTSNPCYQAAVPSSVGYSTSSSKVYSSYKPSSQSTDSYSSTYHGSSSYPSNSHKPSSKFVNSAQPKSNASSYNTFKWFNHSSKNKHSLAAKNHGQLNTSLTLKKPRSHSVISHSTHYPNSNFIQLLPVSTQFPDTKLLPKSMMNISISDQVVNFYPVHKKGPNYLKYCIGWLSNEDKPRSTRDCIWQYTSGPNWYCTEVNMALASDSPKLKSYGSYIKQLKYSIGMSQMKFSGIVFRG
ncbi:unnamed protein product [Rotaria sordida]|uniref:Uncharacterized protein n=1 Tax=Rotaria sordida TaxID=392033 RepID=A0A814R521_9BILA|nr:unnamed protein product [Rotaria sordida]CAF1149081.1 unnamed protein product [Rotaria sordida]